MCNQVDEYCTYYAESDGKLIRLGSFLRVLMIAGYILWHIIHVILAIFPIICHVSTNSRYTRRFEANLTMYILETGLIVWYLLMQCLWVISFMTIHYRYYYFVFYTTLIPYYGSHHKYLHPN